MFKVLLAEYCNVLTDSLVCNAVLGQTVVCSSSSEQSAGVLNRFAGYLSSRRRLLAALPSDISELFADVRVLHRTEAAAQLEALVGPLGEASSIQVQIGRAHV